MVDRIKRTGSDIGTNWTHNAYVRRGGVWVHEGAGIDDKRDRGVSLVVDASGRVLRRQEHDDESGTGDPVSVHYRFGGAEMGRLTNDGWAASDPGGTTESYTSSIEERTRESGTGPFHGGRDAAHGHADFSGFYDPITSYGSTSGPGGGSGAGYTARGGETLSQVALTLWGDAGLWYTLAQANGLSGDATLSAGQSLRLPTGVVRSTFNAATHTPYDAGEALGDLSPTAPQPGKDQGCGVAGQILMTAVSLAVTLALSAIVPAAGSFIGAVLRGAAIAATANAASQGVGIATGNQSRFSWKALGQSAIRGGVNGGANWAFGDATSLVGAVVRGASTNAVSQGIGRATGLQDEFSWTQVAAAGVSAGVAYQVGQWLPGRAAAPEDTGRTNIFGGKVYATPPGGGASFGNALGAGTASALANAATRSALDGESFGDNLVAAIPDVIGQAIGSAAGSAFLGVTGLGRSGPQQQANANPSDATDGGGITGPDGRRYGGSVTISDIAPDGTLIEAGTAYSDPRTQWRMDMAYALAYNNYVHDNNLLATSEQSHIRMVNRSALGTNPSHQVRLDQQRRIAQNAEVNARNQAEIVKAAGIERERKLSVIRANWERSHDGVAGLMSVTTGGIGMIPDAVLTAQAAVNGQLTPADTLGMLLLKGKLPTGSGRVLPSGHQALDFVDFSEEVPANLKLSLAEEATDIVKLVPGKSELDPLLNLSKTVNEVGYVPRLNLPDFYNSELSSIFGTQFSAFRKVGPVEAVIGTGVIGGLIANDFDDIREHFNELKIRFSSNGHGGLYPSPNGGSYSPPPRQYDKKGLGPK